VEQKGIKGIAGLFYKGSMEINKNNSLKSVNKLNKVQLSK
jgi:hypothetical protein